MECIPSKVWVNISTVCLDFLNCICCRTPTCSRCALCYAWPMFSGEMIDYHFTECKWDFYSHCVSRPNDSVEAKCTLIAKHLNHSYYQFYKLLPCSCCSHALYSPSAGLEETLHLSLGDIWMLKRGAQTLLHGHGIPLHPMLFYLCFPSIPIPWTLLWNLVSFWNFLSRKHPVFSRNFPSMFPLMNSSVENFSRYFAV